jgi:zinc/manganese transport system substrate-binding protein
MERKTADMKIRLLLTFAIFAVAFVMAIPARAEIYVVTTDTTLADIARNVGGDKVRVESLARATDDPHHVDPSPRMVLKLSRAQVFARIGMDIDMWVDGPLDRVGNSNVQRGGKGYADCSAGIKVLEIPSGRLDPSMGDIHVYGNPHYLLDPANGIVAAGNIAAALIRVDPANQPYYRQQYLAFGQEIANALGRWRKQLAPYRGQPIVTFHRSWPYFLARFGFREGGTVEPKPGVEPSPGHVADVIRKMKADGARIVLCENFRSHRYPSVIEQQTGAKAVYVPAAVAAEPGADSFIKQFDLIVDKLAAAFAH